MTPTRRGRAVVAIGVTVLLVGGAVAAVALLGGRASVGLPGGPTPTGDSTSAPSPTPSPPPAICPFLGTRPERPVPLRPALAVKVENLPAARPQTGLSWADIVYEEPVEGGITRFIAVYQCQDAERIEPVRSARLSDVDILVQFGRPLFGYAGGVPKVISAVREAKIIDLNFNTVRGAPAYHRDPNRLAPHNLYTSTKELYAGGKGLFQAVAPEPMFTYKAKAPKTAKVNEVHVPFSSSSDVFWKWSASKHAWLRFHGSVPHVSSDGTQFSARNVIVQVVKITLTDVVDANGVPSPEVHSIGTGKAYVFRNGRMVQGTWVRDSAGDLTRFVDSGGSEIPLAPGNTWIELVPQTIQISTS